MSLVGERAASSIIAIKQKALVYHRGRHLPLLATTASVVDYFLMKLLHLSHCLATYILLAWLHTPTTRAATHWVVTEDGRIETREPSYFNLRRPSDLMALLQQEKRVETYEQLQSELASKADIFGKLSFEPSQSMEEDIYNSNRDCIQAKKSLLEYDLHVGTLYFAYPWDLKNPVFPMPPFQELRPYRITPFIDPLYPFSVASKIYGDFYEKNYDICTLSSTNTSYPPSGEEPHEENLADMIRHAPFCSVMKLDFSMAAFEHLAGVRERKQLQVNRESEIHRYLGLWQDYQTFGKDISEGLRINSTSWVYHTLASYYWRGVGQAEQAIECVRRALHTAPDEFRPVPLLSLATILHRAARYDDAKVVLQAVHDLIPRLPYVDYALANLAATTSDYSAAIEHYDTVARLSPGFDQAPLRMHAVKCYRSLEKALLTQHAYIEKSIEDLNNVHSIKDTIKDTRKLLEMERVEPSKQKTQHEEHEKLRQRWQKVQAMQAGDYKANKGNNNKSNSSNTATNKTNNNNNKRSGGEAKKPAKKQLDDKLATAATGAAGISTTSKLTIMDEIRENDKLECLGRVSFDEKGDIWVSYDGQDLRCGGDGIERRRKLVPTSKGGGVYELSNCKFDAKEKDRKRAKTKGEEMFDGFCSEEKIVQVSQDMKLPDYLKDAMRMAQEAEERKIRRP